jgi:hexulose-6-phosphate isomerase
MKRGISCWAFAKGLPIEEIFSLTAKAGLEGIELAYADSGPVNPSTTTDEIKAILKSAAAKNVTVCSLASGIFWSVNLLSDASEERETAKGHVRRMLEIGAALEIGTILVVPGFVGPFEAGAPVVADYETAFDRAVEDFRELASRAEELGVAIGVENVWNKFLSSPFEMRAFLDFVDSPNVGCYFDVGNVMRTGYPEQWIRMLGRRIVGVHFKDFKVGVGNLLGFVDLLEGDVNFPAVMAALRETGYRGYCVAEIFARENDPEAVPLRVGTDMKRIFAQAGIIERNLN